MARRRRRTNLVLLRAVAIVAVTVVMGFPFFWMLSSALKAPAQVFTSPIVWWPNPVRWSNFVDAWNAAPFATYAVNSLWVATLQVIAEVGLGTLAAYAFARLRVPGRDVVFALVLTALMVPSEITLVPNYVTLARMGLVDTYAGLVLPSAVSAFGIFMLRQHMLRLPAELFEAARIDGAGHAQLLRYVAIPLSLPVMATLALLSFVSSWNAYLWPLIITNSDVRRTLPVGLKLLRDAEQGDPWNLLMAASVIVVLPVVVLFLFTQRSFVRGITAGAMKGG
jgi:ABC-type glycerol-3-phosphate transport system permease component